MLFFTRSCLCIGAVLMLIQAPGLTGVGTAEPGRLLGSVSSAAVQRTDALCRSDPTRCLAVASMLASAAWPADRAAHPDLGPTSTAPAKRAVKTRVATQRHPPPFEFAARTP